MKHEKPGLALLILLFITSSASANLFKVYGAGLESCGTWINDRNHPNVELFYLEQWMLGYISAVGDGGEELKISDANAFEAWIDNYCQQRPLDQLIAAVRALTQALRVR